ncbi:MAG: GIY-YIG nuclease family protein [Acidimicrobiales bacterium]
MTDVPKTVALKFEGYWREPTVSGLPTEEEIYCVCTCTYDAEAMPKPTVSIEKLVYIGESSDIDGRVTNHELHPSWRSQLAIGQALCFCSAIITPEADRQRTEAALIFKHKPPVNDEYTKGFGGLDTTTINASGETGKLTHTFTVAKGATSSGGLQRTDRPESLCQLWAFLGGAHESVPSVARNTLQAQRVLK